MSNINIGKITVRAYTNYQKTLMAWAKIINGQPEINIANKFEADLQLVADVTGVDREVIETERDTTEYNDVLDQIEEKMGAAKKE